MLDDDTGTTPATDDMATAEVEQTQTGGETETAQPGEPAKEPAWQRRIDQLTREKYDARREADALKRELEIERALKKGGDQPATSESAPAARAPSPAEIERMVEERAAAKARQDAFNTECNATFKAGKEAFPDFDASVRSMNGMFGDRITREFLDAINSLPNGHEVYHRLAHDTEDAERVLALSPVKMAIELQKLSTAKPKSVSSAPPPVQPVNGRGRTREWTLDDADIPMAEFIRLREKQEADRRARR